MQSPSYRLPLEDETFLRRDEMRSTRLALEYAKVDLLLRDWGIRSTIIVFGGSRVPSPEQAECLLQAAQETNDYANSPEEAWQCLVRRGLRAHTPNGMTPQMA